jgi:predicted lipid-binding transport protein (Tim44 family)
MLRNPFWKFLPPRVLLGVLALLLYAPQGSAIFGVRRRTAVVAYSVGASAGASKEAAASQQQAAAAQESAAAQQSAAASQAAAASAAAASQAAAAAAASKAAAPAAPQKTPQQQLQELDNLLKQGLISQSDYNAAKAKILAQITQ